MIPSTSAEVHRALLSSEVVVTSEMKRFAGLARRPYPFVHHVQCEIGDDVRRHELKQGEYAASVALGDVETELLLPDRKVARDCALVADVAAALAKTGVLGANASEYAERLWESLDLMTCRGALFHNDTTMHWTACLFWVLALDVCDSEFVIPGTAARIRLQPGDLLVFDPALPHGLCRPEDHGQVIRASFEQENASSFQAFLSGELQLTTAQWASLGCTWVDKTPFVESGALDLRLAQFDPCIGSMKAEPVEL